MSFQSPTVVAQRERAAGVAGLLTARLFPHPIASAVTDPFHPYPQQRNPFSAWSTEGIASDEAESGEEGIDYGGGFGY
jgi:hypothetical protein